MTNQEHIYLRSLAEDALEKLFAQKNVTIKHPPDWKRDGFPLPIKREKAAADGTVTQNYRPLAILEYVNEKLANEVVRARMQGNTLRQRRQTEDEDEDEL